MAGHRRWPWRGLGTARRGRGACGSAATASRLPPRRAGPRSARRSTAAVFPPAAGRRLPGWRPAASRDPRWSPVLLLAVGWRLRAGVVVLVDDSAQPLEFVVLPLATRLGAERVGGQLGELDSAAAELVDVVVGAGDVLAARLAVGQVWGAAGVVAGGLEAALGLGGVEHAGHAFGGIDLQGRSYRCQAALAGSLCPIWLSTANTSRAT